MSTVFELQTRSTTYRLVPTATGSGLEMLQWRGNSGFSDGDNRDSRSGFDTPEDLVAHEYAVNGTRHVMESELHVRDEGGHAGALVRLDGEPRLISTPQGQRLSARLRDNQGTITVDLEWESSKRHEVVAKRCVITNEGGSSVQLDQALSGAFNVFLPDGVVIDALSGGWCEEYEQHQISLPRGTFSIGSRQGIVSHLWAPHVTVQDPTKPERGVWSVALAWSGSWRIDVHATSRTGWVRIAGGIHQDAPITLEPGESFVAPQMLGLWAPDPDDAARRWHDYQRHVLMRDTTPTNRSIGYNSWYATEFDVHVDQQIELAILAADLGCEMFVLDDGWFKSRTSDQAGLGDWKPDPVAFPEGLEPLIDAVHSAGMRFGLWVEPEGVNPDSDLFRAHPNWIHRSPKREPVTIRNQYVLNLGLPEVETWALATLRGLLHQGIDHLKWDMNRAITDGGDPNRPDGGWAVAHTHAYHRILDALRADFPHVSLETCSGGGARVAASTLARSDVVWPSDETGPRDRLVIQHGFLSAFPAAAMSSWVTELDGLRDNTPVSLEYRFCVAMCGVLGLGPDLRRWSPSQRFRASRMVELYTRIRSVIFEGTVHRHGHPRGHGYAVEYCSTQNDPATVVFVFGKHGSDETVRIHPNKELTTLREVHLAEAHLEGEELVVTLDPQLGAAIIVAAH